MTHIEKDITFGPAGWTRPATARPAVSGELSLRWAIFAMTVGVLLNAAAPSLLAQMRAGGPDGLSMPDIGVSKVVLACALIGLASVMTGERTRITPAETIAAAPALLGVLAPSGEAAWAGLALSALLLLLTSRRLGPATRNGLWIILAAAASPPMVATMGDLAGGAMLEIDRRIAAALLAALGAELTQGGAVMAAADGAKLLLVWKCGVLGNLSVALLLWFAVIRSVAGRMPVRRVPDAALVALLVIAINSGRLALMALDQSMFDYLHEGAGAALVRFLILSAALGVAIIGAKRHVG